MSYCDLWVSSDGLHSGFCSDPKRARLEPQVDPAVINCLVRIRLHLFVTDMPELNHVDVAGKKCDKQSGPASLLFYWRPFRRKHNPPILKRRISEKRISNFVVSHCDGTASIRTKTQDEFKRNFLKLQICNEASVGKWRERSLTTRRKAKTSSFHDLGQTGLLAA